MHLSLNVFVGDAQRKYRGYDNKISSKIYLKYLHLLHHERTFRQKWPFQITRDVCECAGGGVDIWDYLNNRGAGCSRPPPRPSISAESYIDLNLTADQRKKQPVVSSCLSVCSLIYILLSSVVLANRLSEGSCSSTGIVVITEREANTERSTPALLKHGFNGRSHS